MWCSSPFPLSFKGPRSTSACRHLNLSLRFPQVRLRHWRWSKGFLKIWRWIPSIHRRLITKVATFCLTSIIPRYNSKFIPTIAKTLPNIGKPRMNCKKFCGMVGMHAAVFTLMAAYWIYEGITLLIWISLGVGAAYGSSYLSILITSEKLTNVSETYITIYILVGGVFVQTSAYLLMCEQCMAHLKVKTPIPYLLYRVWPLRLMVGFAFLELFVQFRARFAEESMDYDEENWITIKFLLAACFLGYTLGRKIRFDYRIARMTAGLVFVCPGIIKYCVMFSVFYVIEFLLILLWGSPVIMLAFIFRYYYFDAYLTYFGLAAAGVLLGYGVALMERGCKFRGPFSQDPMVHQIHAEVKVNVILFTLLPMATRWYVRFQFEIPDYEECNKVNFILFSTNVSLLLLYFVKQVLNYKYKMEDDRARMTAARVAIEAVAPQPLEEGAAGQIHFHVGNDHGVNNNGGDEDTDSNDTTSTGTFSDKTTATESSGRNGNHQHHYPNRPWSSTTNLMQGPSSQTHQTTFSLPRDRVRQIPATNIFTHGIQAQRENDKDTTLEDNRDNNNEQLDILPSTSDPLRKPLGIMTINKRWRDQMLNPGHIKKLSYSSHVNRVAIPISPNFMGSRPLPQPPPSISTNPNPELGRVFRFNSRQCSQLRLTPLPKTLSMPLPKRVAFPSNTRHGLSSSSSLSSVDKLQDNEARRHRQRQIHTSSSSSSSSGHPEYFQVQIQRQDDVDGSKGRKKNSSKDSEIV